MMLFCDCGYSRHTWFILLGMIITGAARSIVVKISYQSGFEAPLTVTLLYLLGQSFSLVLYASQKYFVYDFNALFASSNDRFHKEQRHRPHEENPVKLGAYYVQHEEYALPLKHGQNPTTVPSSQHSNLSSIIGNIESSASPGASPGPSFYEGSYISSSGSTHGLTKQSEHTIKWAHRVPFYAKPAIPALLNMLNSALRWASLVYIDASVAEMMISGLELTLSVVAARIFRKRLVSKSRWAGVIVVAVGVTIIEQADSREYEELGSSQDFMIGVVLILLQSILSVLQDLGEEIFMQATDFPPTLMLGLEGLYGFCIGLIVYLAFGDRFGIEDINSTISMLENNSKLRWWIVGLPLLFLLTGYFNIRATEVTSAMTRNVWKNMRTVLVWVLALGIYYLGSGAYGEAWLIPESFLILFGFMVMCTGIIIYYWRKGQEQSNAVLGWNDNLSPKARILT
mmetsp:Transcript_34254/g.82834  ORF Transcript_34254/g.82834 Transcript_34254/m.82834 type:complete len:455 (+) Transcript_34254:219-1583(+)